MPIEALLYCLRNCETMRTVRSLPTLGGEPDNDLADGRNLRVLKFLLGQFDLVQYALAMCDQAPAAFGRRDPAAIAIQQMFFQLQLELSHMAAQDGLRDAKHCRCFGETAEFSHSDEALHLFEIHRHTPQYLTIGTADQGRTQKIYYAEIA